MADWPGSSTPYARVYKAANDTSLAADGTPRAIPWTVEEADNNGIHDNVTNNTRFTCQTPGVYVIEASITATHTSGITWVYITKNGNMVAEERRSADTAVQISVTNIQNLAVGDYIEIFIAAQGGGNITIAGSGTYPANGFATDVSTFAMARLNGA